ncbi:hypothetical protein [Rhizobium arsenicireducens]
MAQVIGGDFRGVCAFKANTYWMGGPQGKHFLGIDFGPEPRASYLPTNIVRVKELGVRSITNPGEAGAAALGGAMAFGLVGAVAGAVTGGRSRAETYGLEFDDGKKAVVREDNVGWTNFLCFKRYVEEQGLLDFDF